MSLKTDVFSGRISNAADMKVLQYFPERAARTLAADRIVTVVLITKAKKMTPL
jgi:hypothetical protein